MQEQYLDDLCPGWRDGVIEVKGLKEFILKARQFGFSTLITALFFLQTINTPNTNTLVVAHDAATSEELFQMVHRFWQNLPEEKRPRSKYNSRRQLYWPGINSRFLVRTAGARAGAGRGLTIHNLHCSEVAFYTNRKLFTGLLQAVPAGGNVFVESTANGESGDGAVFHEEYQKAKAGDSAFTARFYAWWQHEEYEAKPEPGFTRNEEETSLASRLDLDGQFRRERVDRKLQWRRNKRSEPGMGALFAQEYPSDDREAFLVSGSRYFTEWDPQKHVVFESDVTIERHWNFFGGFDWGFGKPFCFLLACADERGRVLIIDEEYHTRLNDPDQAQKVKECLARWSLDPARVPIYADPAMWANKTDWSGKKIQNVAAFLNAGLKFVKAANERVHGWMNFRRYLHDVDKPDPNLPDIPFLRVLAGRCPNLIRTMPLQVHDKTNPEDMETDSGLVEDHAPDTARYLLASRPRPSKPDPDKPQPPTQRSCARQQETHVPSWLKNAQKKKKL